MKKLISAQTVKQAHRAGRKEIEAPPATTLVTPEARSIAEKLGLKILDVKKQEKKSDSAKVDAETVEQVIKQVLETLPENKYTQEDVRKVVIEVLSGR